jgi:hypothetical protein
MLRPDDVHSLTDFHRKTKAVMQRLRRSGRPELLTINGKGVLVVQDAAAFAKMVEGFDRERMIEAVKVGIEQMEAGKTRPWKVAKKDIQARIASAKSKRRSA